MRLRESRKSAITPHSTTTSTDSLLHQLEEDNLNSQNYFSLATDFYYLAVKRVTKLSKINAAGAL